MRTDIHKNYTKTLDLVTANNDIFKPPRPQETTTLIQGFVGQEKGIKCKHHGLRYETNSKDRKRKEF